jgi:hypothetical protein
MYTTLEFRVVHCTKIAAWDTKMALKQGLSLEIIIEKIKTLQLMLNVLEDSRFNSLMQLCFELTKSGDINLEAWETTLINKIDELCSTIPKNNLNK